MPPPSVVVAVSGQAHDHELLERARALAGEAGSVRAVHVSRSSSSAPLDRLEHSRMLAEALSATWHTVVDDDVAGALASSAAEARADTLVVGARRHRAGRSKLIRRLLRADVCVVVVPHREISPSRIRPSVPAGLPPTRQLAAAGVGAALLCGLTPLLITLRGQASLDSDLLLYLLGVVLVTLVGGLLPGLLIAVLASLTVDWWFVPPLHRLSINSGGEVLALAVFIAVAALVSSSVGLADRRSREAARAGAEADTLSTLAGDVLRGRTALPALLSRIREGFGAAAVHLQESGTPGWITVAADTGNGAAELPVPSAQTVTVTLPLGEKLRLLVDGPPLTAANQRVLLAFAAHAAVLLEQRRMAELEEQAQRSTETDRMRTALLAAVSHDLRTPLAAAKTAVSGLLDEAVDWRPQQRQELLQTADHALDRLTSLVDDLLDLSRLQAGVLPVRIEAVSVEDVLLPAIDAVSEGRLVRLQMGRLPPVLADPVLLERVIANLVQNALRHGPEDVAPTVTAEAHDAGIIVSVVDRGPGMSPDRYREAFLPFQRLGDRPSARGGGVGLGLAVARGFTDAMGGSLEPAPTPGGGLTMVLTLPAAGWSPR